MTEAQPEVAALRALLLSLAADRTGMGLRDLRPRDDDYAKVFRPATIGRARCRYETLWAGPIDFRHPPGGCTVEVRLAAAARLGDALAALLVPDRLWAGWTYRAGTVGLTYDGLAWCDDHWAWFPKPGRLIS